MKTKRILSALLAVLVCAAMAVSFVSCGDDEETPGDDTSEAEGIEGEEGEGGAEEGEPGEEGGEEAEG